MYNFLEQQDFEDWLALIPLKLQNLARRLEGQIDLKDDMASVSALSEWVLKNYHCYEKLTEEPEEGMDDCLRP